MPTAALILLIGFGVVVVIGVLGMALGMFRIERVERKLRPEGARPAPAAPAVPEPAELAEALETMLEQDADEVDQEALETYDFFGDEEVEVPDDSADIEIVPGSLFSEDEEFDALCGLKVGLGYLSDCQAALADAAVEGRVFAVACFDFDRFRIINSLKGYSIGDYALSRMAQELGGIFPMDAVSTRLDSDRFAVLFPLPIDSELDHYSESLRRLSEQIREDIGAKSGLRVALGIAKTESAESYDITTLLHRADIARHCSKIAKNEGYAVYDETMAQTCLYGETSIDEYNENQYESDEYVVRYQPFEDLQRGRVIGCSALAHWTCGNASNREMDLTPNNGRITANNLHVFYQTCRNIGRWRKAGKEVLVATVYLPITDLYKQDIDHYLAKCLSAFQVDPQTVVVEIEASVIPVDIPTAVAQFKKIKDIGVGIAICGIHRNIGTLTLPEGLQFDYLKFHSSFAWALAQASTDEGESEIRQLIADANSIGCQTIFEGVDSDQQARLLRECGAHYVVGGWVGKSELADAFAKSLNEAGSAARATNATKILDDDELAKGNYNVY